MRLRCHAWQTAENIRLAVLPVWERLDFGHVVPNVLPERLKIGYLSADFRNHN